VLTLAVLALAVWAHHTGRPWQTMLFVGLTCAQLGVALGLRTRPLGLANPFLPAAVVGSLLLALAGVYLPGLQSLLGTVPLSAGDVLLALSPAVAGWAVAVAVVVRRHRGPGSSRPSSLLPDRGADEHGRESEGVVR
jgi:P-type Ca2+ transporter type 2C